MIPEIFRMLTVAVDPRQRFIAVFGVKIPHRRFRVLVAGFAHHLQAGSGVLRTFWFGIGTEILIQKRFFLKVAIEISNAYKHIPKSTNFLTSILVLQH